jgi:hypothetical protein
LLPWKISYYKVSQQEFGFLESIPVGIKREKPSGRIRKTTKMIFSPSTGGLKPYLISFKYLELGNVLDYHSFIINYAG